MKKLLSIREFCICSVTVALFALAGCGNDVSEAKQEPLVVKSHPPATHCRIGVKDNNGLHQEWSVVNLNPTDDPVSRGSYYIFNQWKYPYPSSIEISYEDKVKIRKVNDTTVRMQHFDKDGILLSDLDLNRNSDGLWYEGNLTVGRRLEGTYYLFRLPDAGYGYYPYRDECQHPDRYSTQCKRIHLEFFDVDHDDLNKFRPEIDRNVNVGECLGGAMESQDGDGDDGHD